MTTDELLQDAKDKLVSRIKYGDFDSIDDAQDAIREIADSCLPIYNADRIEVFLSDSDLWYDSCGDAETVLDAITWAIYERINQYLWDIVEDVFNEEAENDI